MRISRQKSRHRILRAHFIGFFAGIVTLVVILVGQMSPSTFSQDLQRLSRLVIESQPGLWRVTQVSDGDTIVVEQGSTKETVRLLGIDTPETHDPRKPVQCFGRAAADHTKQLLKDKQVRLEPDSTNSDRDKYRRLLRYVYLPDGTLVNATLVRDGYAFAYTIFPFVRLDEFRALERQAREQNRGLWSNCTVNESSQVKQTNDATQQ